MGKAPRYTIAAGLLFLASLFAPIGATAEPLKIGVYNWAGSDGVRHLNDRFIPFWGAKPDLSLEFLAFNSWSYMEGVGTWAFRAWRGKTPNLAVGIPLTTQGTPLEDVANGEHDRSFRKLAKELSKAGFDHAIIRLGWEPNGNWYPWGNLGKKQAAETFIAAFRHVAGVFKSVSPNFVIQWCVAGGAQLTPPPTIYPGDDVVDQIGIDIYAAVWGVEHPSAERVIETWKGQYQLDWAAQFAKEHGKSFAIGEFGVGDRPQGKANYGPGDNAEAAEFAVDWMLKHAPKGDKAGPGELEWVGLWDVNAGDYNSEFSSGKRPNVARVLREKLSPAAQ